MGEEAEAVVAEVEEEEEVARQPSAPSARGQPRVVPSIHRHYRNRYLRFHHR